VRSNHRVWRFISCKLLVIKDWHARKVTYSNQSFCQKHCTLEFVELMVIELGYNGLAVFVKPECSILYTCKWCQRLRILWLILPIFTALASGQNPFLSDNSICTSYFPLVESKTSGGMGLSSISVSSLKPFSCHTLNAPDALTSPRLTESR